MEREPQSGEQLPKIESPELERSPEQAGQAHEAQERPEERQERLETARETLEQQPEQQPQPPERESAPARHITQLDRAVNYKHTLRSLQRQLGPAGRSFSKVIHVPVVEKVSEVAAKTVFRPSVTLGASLTALLVGGVAFFTARRYGFPLSGSEFLFAILFGGVVGVVLEGAGKLLHRGR